MVMYILCYCRVMALLILIILRDELWLAGLLDFHLWSNLRMVFNAAHKLTACTEKDSLQEELIWQLHLWLGLTLCSHLQCIAPLLILISENLKQHRMSFCLIISPGPFVSTEDEALHAALRRGLEPFHEAQSCWQGLLLQGAPRDVAAGPVEASQTLGAGCPTFCNVSSGGSAHLAFVLGFTHAVASHCCEFGPGYFL